MSAVELAIYDLSRGMARQLSAQFLGPQFSIDVVPHTGIVVYNQEFFFGQGIQSEDPLRFRQDSGMQPLQTIQLGQTNVSESEFRAWCRRVANEGRYNTSSYDLLTRNCNNFSHDAALQGLKLSQGVPEWILQVPGRFLASPMGQMVRPMLENMQLTSVGGANQVVTAETSSNLDSNNPWANISTASASSRELLDTLKQPLLSRDTKSVSVCVKKVSAQASAEEQKVLAEAADYIVANAKLSNIEIVNDIILRELDGSNESFALMLLRLLVLQPPATSFVSCLAWIQETIPKQKSLSRTGRAMTWTVLGNHVGTHGVTGLSLDELVDSANADCSTTASEAIPTRQAASAFLFNVMMNFVKQEPTEEIDDVYLGITLCVAENVEHESDETTRWRRLATVGLLVDSRQQYIAILQDLELGNTLDRMSNSLNTQKSAGLAKELRSLLSSNNN